MALDPYAPPRLPIAPDDREALREAALAGLCPRCRGADVKRLRWTWWGAAVGPLLLGHTVCQACGFGFNRRTGRNNGGKIAVYVVLMILVAIGLAAAPYWNRLVSGSGRF